MNKCGNISCECEVTLHDQMCSDYCERSGAKNIDDIRCHCEHEKCSKAIASELGGSPG